ncbi:MAG: hypothetical protein PVG20_01750 [Thioalkalispiraceae bacterium]
MGSPAQIMWAMFFGAIGLGFFTYGKRQKAIVPLMAGISLFIFPYFISNVYLLVAVGAGIVVVPYFIRI